MEYRATFGEIDTVAMKHPLDKLWNLHLHSQFNKQSKSFRSDSVFRKVEKQIV